MKKKGFFAAIAILLAISCLNPIWALRGSKSDVERNLNVFGALFRELQTSYVDTINTDDAMRMAIDAMLFSLDPYTEYIPEEELEEFSTIATGEYAGIGALLMERDGKVYVANPYENSPANRAGLRPGDLIVAVDGDTVLGQSTDKIIPKLKGQPGTHVSVMVHRPWVGADSVKVVDITRAMVTVDEMPYHGIVDGHIGYMKLNTFNEHSAPSILEALKSFKANPAVDAYVLDLRDNGGGLLDQAVKIVSYFVPKGTEVLRSRGREPGDETIYKTSTAPIDTKTPLFVLINGNSASASEIVTGALQDLDRAVVVGSRSFGKGLVQGQRPLPYNGLLKLTVAKYYIPSGRLIQALDYKNRNDDGSPAHLPDSLTKVFYTRVGRPVRDGGGIMPEIEVEHPKPNTLIYTAQNDHWIFDFANRYAATHPSIPEPENFVVDDETFDDFKAFIDPSRFNYSFLTDAAIDRLRESAELEGYLTDSVKAHLDDLKILMKHDLNHDLDINRRMLINLLEREIASRYYHNRGYIIRGLDMDSHLDSVKAVLSNPGQYARLLSKPAK